MDVGVRALKERLSEYLDRAARGELIVITDRGEPKAVLGPVPGRLNLDAGVAEKWIQPGNGEPPGRAQRFKSTANVGDVLRDDRGE